MATMEQRGESWRVYWRLDGHRNGPKQSCTFPTLPQAQAAKMLVESPSRRHRITAEETYRAVLGLDGTDPQAPTVAQWATDWITARRKLADIQPDTIDGYKRLIQLRVLPRLGKLRLPQVSTDEVSEWVAWLNAQPSRRGGTLGAETVRRAHAVLHSLLGAAVPRWIAANPCAKPAGSRKRKAGLPKAHRHDAVFLTPTEIDILIANCDAHIADMVYVSVRTGLRLGELLVLRVEDVTLTGKRKVIRVRRALKQDGTIGPPKSRRSRRDVSISAEVALRLKPRTTGKRPSALLFTSPHGKRWTPSNLHRRHWAPALAAAQRCAAHPPPKPEKGKTGPPRKLRNDEVSTCNCATRLHRSARWHDLRHTAVSLCVEAGWDPTRVQRRVGHESITTTMDLYGHLWEGTDDGRLDDIEKLLKLEDDEAA
jgi:integrase